MDYPYRLGGEVVSRGVAVTEVLSADGLSVFGTIRRNLGTKAVTAVSASGTTLGHFRNKVEAAKEVALWGVENAEGRNHG